MRNRSKVLVGLASCSLAVATFTTLTASAHTTEDVPPPTVSAPVQAEPTVKANVSAIPSGFTLTKTETVEREHAETKQLVKVTTQRFIKGDPEAGDPSVIRVDIATGAPTLDIEKYLQTDTRAQKQTVRGKPGAIVSGNDGRGMTVVSWAENPAVNVQIVGRGASADDVLAVAEGISLS